MKLSRIVGRMGLSIKRNSPTILVCLASVGTIATAVLSAKATPKAILLVDEAKKEKQEDLTVVETVIAAAPAYIPAATACASTIFCMFGANGISRRRQASLASAYFLVKDSYDRYREKVKVLLGDKADSEVMASVIRDRCEENEVEYENRLLFFEEHLKEPFERTIEEVMTAEYQFNRRFARRGHASLNEFYELLGLPKIEDVETLGWSAEAGCELYGYAWVDFAHELVVTDDGLECYIISMPFPPTTDYLFPDYWREDEIHE